MPINRQLTSQQDVYIAIRQLDDEITTLRNQLASVQAKVGDIKNAVNGSGGSGSGGGISNITFAGDLFGSNNSQTVVGLQNKPISATVPIANQLLDFDGTNWIPTSDINVHSLVVSGGTTLNGGLSVLGLNCTTDGTHYCCLSIDSTSYPGSFMGQITFQGTGISSVLDIHGSLLVDNQTTIQGNSLTVSNGPSGDSFTLRANDSNYSNQGSIIGNHAGQVLNIGNTCYHWAGTYFHGNPSLTPNVHKIYDDDTGTFYLDASNNNGTNWYHCFSAVGTGGMTFYPGVTLNGGLSVKGLNCTTDGAGNYACFSLDPNWVAGYLFPSFTVTGTTQGSFVFHDNVLANGLIYGYGGQLTIKSANTPTAASISLKSNDSDGNPSLTPDVSGKYLSLVNLGLKMGNNQAIQFWNPANTFANHQIICGSGGNFNWQYRPNSTTAWGNVFSSDINGNVNFHSFATQNFGVLGPATFSSTVGVTGLITSHGITNINANIDQSTGGNIRALNGTAFYLYNSANSAYSYFVVDASNNINLVNSTATSFIINPAQAWGGAVNANGQNLLNVKQLTVQTTVDIQGTSCSFRALGGAFVQCFSPDNSQWCSLRFISGQPLYSSTTGWLQMDASLNIGGSGALACNNAATIGGNGIKYSAMPNNTNVHAFNWTGALQAYVNGSNVGNITLTSERWMKEDIKPYESGLDKILKLKPASYKYKVQPWKGEGQIHYGLIADEVESVAPEMIEYHTTEVEGEQKELRYTNPRPMWYMMLNAIKELSNRIEILESRQ